MEVTTGPEPVLRLWSYIEAPSTFRAEFPEAESDTWIAHVPRELVDNPLSLLLTLNASPERPLSHVHLADGSVLFLGAFLVENRTPAFQRVPKDDLIAAANSAGGALPRRGA